MTLIVESKCIWRTPNGVCGPDISQPGRQVLCCVVGCLERIEPIAPEKLRVDKNVK